jgi:hypothetical protein
MTFIAFPLALGFFGGIAFLFGGAAYWLRKWSLSPLAIPNNETFRGLHRRERFLTLLLLSMFFLFPLWLISVGVLLMSYGIGLYRHIKSRTNPPEGAFAKAPPVPIIPRFSLSDLMAIVFSFGCAPAILLPVSSMQQTQQREMTVTIFIIAIITFPACFLCVLYRLECHRIPAGVRRMACVALAPYVNLGSILILPLTILGLLVLEGRGDSTMIPWIYLAVSIVLLVAGRVFANMASADAPPPVDEFIVDHTLK